MFPILAELFKKIPTLCWAVFAMCALMYTATLCFVMLRSSAVNVTIDGMTMEMSRAAATTDSAAAELDDAAKTIADLKAQLAAAKTPLMLQAVQPPAPAPVAVLAPVETGLRAKASQMRKQSEQIQQQVQQQQQQQQQQR